MLVLESPLEHEDLFALWVIVRWRYVPGTPTHEGDALTGHLVQEHLACAFAFAKGLEGSMQMGS